MTFGLPRTKVSGGLLGEWPLGVGLVFGRTTLKGAPRNASVAQPVLALLLIFAAGATWA